MESPALPGSAVPSRSPRYSFALGTVSTNTLAMTARRVLVLVRHGMPVVDDRASPREWVLSEDGRRRARALASRIDLPADALLVSSDEAKAKETAQELAEEFTVDQRLREVTRPWLSTDYERVARRWLAGEDLDGWEPRSDVVERMKQAVDEAFGWVQATVCVVSHGLAISALMAELSDVDPGRLWSKLGFPDSVTIDYPM